MFTEKETIVAWIVVATVLIVGIVNGRACSHQYDEQLTQRAGNCLKAGGELRGGDCLLKGTK